MGNRVGRVQESARKQAISDFWLGHVSPEAIKVKNGLSGGRKEQSKLETLIVETDSYPEM